MCCSDRLAGLVCVRPALKHSPRIYARVLMSTHADTFSWLRASPNPLPALSSPPSLTEISSSHITPNVVVASGSLGVIGDACGVVGVSFPGSTFTHGGASRAVEAAIAAARAAGGEAATARWDAIESALPASWSSAARGVPRVGTALAWDPSGALLAVGGSDGMIVVLPAAAALGVCETAPPAAILHASDGAITCIAWVPIAVVRAAVEDAVARAGPGVIPPRVALACARASMLVTTGNDGVMRLWRLGVDGATCRGDNVGSDFSLEPSLLANFALASAAAVISVCPVALPLYPKGPLTISVAVAVADGSPTLVAAGGATLFPLSLVRTAAEASITRVFLASQQDATVSVPTQLGAIERIASFFEIEWPRYSTSFVGARGGAGHPDAPSGAPAFAEERGHDSAGIDDADAATEPDTAQPSSVAEASTQDEQHDEHSTEAAAGIRLSESTVGGAVVDATTVQTSPPLESATASLPPADRPDAPVHGTAPSRGKKRIGGSGNKDSSAKRHRQRALMIAIRPSIESHKDLVTSFAWTITDNYASEGRAAGEKCVALMAGTLKGSLLAWAPPDGGTPAATHPIVPVAVFLSPGTGAVRSLDPGPLPTVPAAAGEPWAGTVLRWGWEGGQLQAPFEPGRALLVEGGIDAAAIARMGTAAPRLQAPLLISHADGSIRIVDTSSWRTAPLTHRSGDAVPLIPLPILSTVKSSRPTNSEMRTSVVLGSGGRDGSVVASLSVSSDASNKRELRGAPEFRIFTWVRSLTWVRIPQTANMGSLACPVGAGASAGVGVGGLPPSATERMLRLPPVRVTYTRTAHTTSIPYSGIQTNDPPGAWLRAFPGDGPLHMACHPTRPAIATTTRFGRLITVDSRAVASLGITALAAHSRAAIAAAHAAGAENSAAARDALERALDGSAKSMVEDDVDTLRSVRILFGGGAASEEVYATLGVRAPQTWSTWAPFLLAPELSTNVVYVEKETEFDSERGSRRDGSGGAGGERGSSTLGDAAPVPFEDVDVQVRACAGIPARQPPFASPQTLERLDVIPQLPRQPAIPIGSLRTMVVSAGDDAASFSRRPVILSRTAWLSSDGFSTLQADSGAAAPPKEVLLDALQAEGLRALCGTTGRR